ncbi:YxiJ-like family protein [Niallia taxi]|uniref:YxiJ family protein n=1 Tax=Niallia taxi TaxID=2499688 RepID=UPI002934CD90|nr:YxiJ family protein [Niallia taxi]WOD61315.1 YxiJ-like family protein [Niallia taxi]
MGEKLKKIELSQLVQVNHVNRNSLHAEVLHFFYKMIGEVCKEKYPNTIKQLLQLSLQNPFPYQDSSKIQQDFKKQLLEEDCLIADLNTYWMMIAGSLSFLIRGQSRNISPKSIAWLQMSFFEIFKQYQFLEPHIDQYPYFYKEYIHFDKARHFIVFYLFLQSSNDVIREEL